MTSFSKKALEILQAESKEGKEKFTTSSLIAKGFSEEAAKVAVKELEDAGYIFIESSYISGGLGFRLL